MAKVERVDHRSTAVPGDRKRRLRDFIARTEKSGAELVLVAVNTLGEGLVHTALADPTDGPTKELELLGAVKGMVRELCMSACHERDQREKGTGAIAAAKIDTAALAYVAAVCPCPDCKARREAEAAAERIALLRDPKIRAQDKVQ